MDGSLVTFKCYSRLLCQKSSRDGTQHLSVEEGRVLPLSCLCGLCHTYDRPLILALLSTYTAKATNLAVKPNIDEAIYLLGSRAFLGHSFFIYLGLTIVLYYCNTVSILLHSLTRRRLNCSNGYSYKEGRSMINYNVIVSQSVYQANDYIARSGHRPPSYEHPHQSKGKSSYSKADQLSPRQGVDDNGSLAIIVVGGARGCI